MIIYKATNRLNGKVYIGATTKSLKDRIKFHIISVKYSLGSCFHKAIRKYGIENFKWEVICICPNINSLNEQEQYYIKFYDTMNIGYNNTSGGTSGYTMSERIKKQTRKSIIRSIKEKKKYGDDYYSYYIKKYLETQSFTLILK